MATGGAHNQAALVGYRFGRSAAASTRDSSTVHMMEPSCRLFIPIRHAHGRHQVLRALFSLAIGSMTACGGADSPPTMDSTAVSDTGATDGVSTTVITDEPSCESCTIELLRVATLGDTALPGGLSDEAGVWAGGDGRFYVIDVVVAPSRVLVYDSIGRYVTAFGRSGSGPGEYAVPVRVMSRGPDTIQVVALPRRLTTILTRDHSVARIERLPLDLMDHAILGDGTLVINGILRTREAIGYPLHRLGDSLEVLASFGTDDPRFDPTDAAQPWRSRRALAPAGGDRFWAAPPNRFSAELWDADGNRIRRLVRNVAWFQPWTNGWAPWIAPPPPRLWSIRQDDAGILWVVVHVPDPNWRRIPARQTNIPDHEKHMPVDYHEFYDTVVEAWDLSGGRFLTSLRSDFRMKGFLYGGLLYSAREDEVGNYFYDVWKLTLTHTRGGD